MSMPPVSAGSLGSMGGSTLHKSHELHKPLSRPCLLWASRSPCRLTGLTRLTRLTHIAELLQQQCGSGSRSEPGRLEIRRELERLVRKQVNRLHHRSENRLLRNEPDLALVTLDDGEAVSITELVPEPSRQPDEALIRFGRFKLFFSVFLGRDRRLLRLSTSFATVYGGPKTSPQASN